MDTTETIDITPTWTALMPYLIHMVQAGGKAEIEARKELMRLAAAADAVKPSC